MALKIDDIASYQAAVNENPNNIASKQSGGRSKRAVGIHTKFWNPSRNLTISFLDNPPQSLKDAIKKLILEWDDYVSLTFSFIDGKNGTIRIKTDTNSNASQIGTDALAMDADEPTMYIASRPTDSEFRTAVLHEFGHALGLHHEHLHPDANIPWNKPKVYKEYAEKWGMDKKTVDWNIFTPISDPLAITGYDKTSIMHYPVEKELTDGNFEIPLNTEISHDDKRIMNYFYPIETPSPIETPYPIEIPDGGSCERP